MPSMTLMMSEMRRELSEMPFMVSTTCDTTAPPLLRHAARGLGQLVGLARVVRVLRHRGPQFLHGGGGFLQRAGLAFRAGRQVGIALRDLHAGRGDRFAALAHPGHDGGERRIHVAQALQQQAHFVPRMDLDALGQVSRSDGPGHLHRPGDGTGDGTGHPQAEQQGHHHGQRGPADLRRQGRGTGVFRIGQTHVEQVAFGLGELGLHGPEVIHRGLVACLAELADEGLHRDLAGVHVAAHVLQRLHHRGEVRLAGAQHVEPLLLLRVVRGQGSAAIARRTRKLRAPGSRDRERPHRRTAGSRGRRFPC